MEEMRSKVYVLTDEHALVIRCEGGYTMSNITDLENWVFIDEGFGDRYNLCQSHYFEGGLYTEDGIPRYKLVNGQPRERSVEEIQADREAMPRPDPLVSDNVTWAELAAAIQEGVNSV